MAYYIQKEEGLGLALNVLVSAQGAVSPIPDTPNLVLSNYNLLAVSVPEGYQIEGNNAAADNNGIYLVGYIAPKRLGIEKVGEVS